MYQNISEYTRIYQNISEYIRIYHNVSEYIRVTDTGNSRDAYALAYWYSGVWLWLSDSVTDTGNSRDAYASKNLGNKKSKLGTNLGTSINKM